MAERARQQGDVGVKTTISKRFGDGLGRVLSKAEFMPEEHPRGEGGKFVSAGDGTISQEDLARAERSIKMRGAAHVGDVDVKIVPHNSGDGYGVETTVSGDRRYPTEPKMSLEEAQKLAVEQLKNPRPKPTPAQESPKQEAPKPPSVEKPYKSVGDLAAKYKAEGVDRNRAWTRFVQDTILQPRFRSEAVDAKQFFQAYDRA